MEYLLVLLIAGILSGCLAYVNSLLNDLVPIVLHAERYMDTMLGTNGLTEVFNIFFGFGVSLIVLKFKRKALSNIFFGQREMLMQTLYYAYRIF
ncbi:hypothetical protein GCM10008908_35290 [Clostridium subterminale]|uniref:Uncharacterized protein n=1 Tax=Clostridium subterminale TaxID=1550 RepID=A0ABN1KY80_CLOSU